MISEGVLFLLIGLLVVIAGVVLLVKLLRRESLLRRTRRCPKCLYDMTGARTPVCSECGHDAKGERGLHRILWRQARVYAAVLLIMFGIGTMRWPMLRDHHWPYYVPTSTLITMWGYVDWEWSTRELGRRMRVNLDSTPRLGPRLVAAGQPTSEQINAFAQRAIPVLCDDSAAVQLRISLLRWLDRYGCVNESLAVQLAELINSTSDRDLQYRAIQAISNDSTHAHLLADSTLVEHLIETHTNASMNHHRRAALRALTRSEHEAALDHVEYTLRSGDPQDKSLAAQFVPLNERYISLLIDALGDPDIQHTAARRLGEAQFDPDTMLPRLATLLTGEADDAAFGVQALADYGELAQPYLPEMISMLGADEHGTRRAAAWAIRDLAYLPATRTAVPLLVDMLMQGDDSEDISAAAAALSYFSSDDLKPFESELQSMIAELKPAAASWTEQSLRQIETLLTREED